MTNLIPIALLFLASRGRREVPWPTPPLPPSPPWTPPGKPPGKDSPPSPPWTPPGKPPGKDSPPSPPTDDVPPAAAARYTTIRRGEGPYQLVQRCCGQRYARSWKHLADANPNLRLNKARDNFSTATWRAGDQIRIPDDWPGGESRVSGLDTI